MARDRYQSATRDEHNLTEELRLIITGEPAHGSMLAIAASVVMRGQAPLPSVIHARRALHHE